MTQNCGVDGQEVFQWAGENLKNSKKAEVMRRIFYGDRSVFEELLHRYNDKS
jgi:hypothetical protein